MKLIAGRLYSAGGTVSSIAMLATAVLREFIRTTRVLLETAIFEQKNTPAGCSSGNEMAYNSLFSLLARRTAAGLHLDEETIMAAFPGPALKNLPEELEDRLEDKDLLPFWGQEETLGWAYQFWNERERLEIFHRLYHQKKKIQAEEIPAATQLFTPVWITRYLIENTFGRLWLEMHPDSRLIEQLPYLVLPPAFSQFQPLRRVEQITLFDPACGCMHFGLAAFDLFAACYQEEFDRAGEPGWPAAASVSNPAEIPAAILRHNLHGTDIDPRAVRLARLVLTIKAARLGGERLPAVSNLVWLQETGGALISGRFEQRYDCVVTNPPYMIRRNMPPELASFLQTAYPDARGDLYAAFIQRSLGLCRPGGRVGMITQQSFMFLPSYRKLRTCLLEVSAVETVLHLGPHAFAEIQGEKVNTAAFTLRIEPEQPGRNRPTVFFRLERWSDAETKRQAFERALAALAQPDQENRTAWDLFCTLPQTFSDIPGCPWVYWAPPGIVSAFRRFPNLTGVPGTDGNKTGANARYIRPCADIPALERENRPWRRLARPAHQLAYAQKFEQMVDWSPEAQAFYRTNPSSSKISEDLSKRAGISWSRVASCRFSARRFPAGVIPDVSTPALYPPENESAFLIALMNSKPGRYFLRMINPTINYSLGDVRHLPIPPAGPREKEALTLLVERIEAAYANATLPVDPAFLAQQEAEIDRLIYRLYQFSEEEIGWIEQEMDGQPARG